MSLKPYVLIALILIPLAGCTKYVWVKPVGDQSTYPQDHYKCSQDAIKLAPPAYQIIETSRKHKKERTIETHCTGPKKNQKCLKRVKNSEYHPQERTIDLNVSNRKGLYNACMQAKGWVLTPVESQ